MLIGGVTAAIVGLAGLMMTLRSSK
jgi:hypothetical protein